MENNSPNQNGEQMSPPQNGYPNQMPPPQNGYPNQMPPPQNGYPNQSPPPQNSYPNQMPPPQNGYGQNYYPQQPPYGQNYYPQQNPAVKKSSSTAIIIISIIAVVIFGFLMIGLATSITSNVGSNSNTKKDSVADAQIAASNENAKKIYIAAQTICTETESLGGRINALIIFDENSGQQSEEYFDYSFSGDAAKEAMLMNKNEFKRQVSELTNSYSRWMVYIEDNKVISAIFQDMDNSAGGYPTQPDYEQYRSEGWNFTVDTLLEKAIGEDGTHVYYDERFSWF
jgi:hypothetical protein